MRPWDKRFSMCYSMELATGVDFGLLEALTASGLRFSMEILYVANVASPILISGGG